MKPVRISWNKQFVQLESLYTYMAADSLKAKAAELGIAIKVETKCINRYKNGLTKVDIEGATAIIVAADKQVEMNRFAGKHVIQARQSLTGLEN